MKPIYQTRFGNNGNCHAACIASILEIPLKKIDIFYNISDNPDINEKKKVYSQFYASIEGKVRMLGYSYITLGYNCVKLRLEEINAINNCLPSDINDEISAEKINDIIRDSDELKTNCYGTLPEGHCILSLKNTDKNSPGHAVVGKIENGKIVVVHDPDGRNVSWIYKTLSMPNPVIYDLDKYCHSLQYFVKIS